MRAIFILPIFVIFIISGCTSVEIAKEVTKVTKSIKSSIEKATSSKEEVSSEEELEKNISNQSILEEKILIKKNELIVEKKNEEEVVLKQNKIATIVFIGKTLDELTKQLGNPKLLRKDGKSMTARFDTKSCRIFIFFNTFVNKPRAEYYELRNVNGGLVNRQKDIENCYSEIKLV